MKFFESSLFSTRRFIKLQLSFSFESFPSLLLPPGLHDALGDEVRDLREREDGFFLGEEWFEEGKRASDVSFSSSLSALSLSLCLLPC